MRNEVYNAIQAVGVDWVFTTGYFYLSAEEGASDYSKVGNRHLGREVVLPHQLRIPRAEVAEWDIQSNWDYDQAFVLYSLEAFKSEGA